MGGGESGWHGAHRNGAGGNTWHCSVFGTGGDLVLVKPVTTDGRVAQLVRAQP